jgi:5-methylcytosine-specific restriction endonuclease McrA
MTRNQKRSIIGDWAARRKLGCFWCGKPFLPHHKTLEATIEHFFPISRGGSPKDFNTVVAHQGCNRQHGNRLPNEVAIRKFVAVKGNDAVTSCLHFAGAIVLGVAR